MPLTYQSTVVKASLEDVWDRVSDFHDLSWAPDVITNCEKIGDVDGREVGAKRVLNEAFHETVTRIIPGEHVFEYSIDDGPAPVSKNDVKDYIGAVRLIPITDNDTCLIEWSSNWESPKDDACDFCHNIYVAVIDELKKSF